MAKFSELPLDIQREIKMHCVWKIYPPTHEQIVQIVKYDGKFYHDLPIHLQTREYLLLALQNWTYSSPLSAPGAKKFSSDREVVMTAVKFNGCDLAYASEDLSRDGEIIRIALANDDISISNISGAI
jgi:hypothetical protein